MAVVRGTEKEEIWASNVKRDVLGDRERLAIGRHGVSTVRGTEEEMMASNAMRDALGYRVRLAIGIHGVSIIRGTEEEDTRTSNVRMAVLLGR